MFVPTLEQLYAAAGLSGFVSWVALNRRPVDGDTGVAFYTLALGALYAAFRYTGPFAAHALRTTFAVAGIYAFSTLFFTVLYRLSPWHPLAKYPGPRLWHVSSLVLSYYSFRGRRHLYLDELHAKYGPFLRIGPDCLSVNSLSAQHIYSAQAHMPKAESYRAPGHNKPVAMFFKQPFEKLHSDRKRIWSAMFTKEGLHPLFGVLEKRTNELMQCMERRAAQSPDGSVDLTECFYHWSYDFMGDMVFGGANQLELMRNGDSKNLVLGGKLATRMVDSIGQTPWLLDVVWHLPSGGAMHRMIGLAASMVQKRLATKELPAYRDLMSYWIEKVSVSDMEWDAIIAIIGGSDNTSITMALAVFFLTTEPHYWQTLRAEVEKAFPDRSEYMHPDELAKLPFLEGVVQEALRLGSPYFLPRIVPRGGATIDDRYIPEGTTVALAAYSQQMDPANFFPDPLNFRPERWLPDGMGPQTKANKNAINSFSWGPHACIAKAFAYQEMRYVLARLVLCMDIKPVDGFDVAGFRNGITNMRTTILEENLMVNVRRREGAKIE